MKTLHALVPAVSVLLTVVACGSSDGSGDGVPDPNGGTSGAPSTSGSSGKPSGGTSGSSGTSGSGGTSGSSGTMTNNPLTIFTIVMENHDYDEIVGKTSTAPFINSLIDDYGLATNYMDSGTHPSLPNYLTMISGDPQYLGVLDLNPDTYPFPVQKDNLGSQLEAAKIPWRSYQETMGTPCNLSGASGPTGDYAPKHDPFLYFTDMQKTTAGLCEQTNVDFSSFAADLAAGTYRYMWITPNLTNDGHDPNANTTDFVKALKQSDAWAKTVIQQIIASTVYKNNGIIFLTWDEAEGRTSGAKSKDQVPMIVISPNIKSKGFKSAMPYSHKSYLATVEDLLKLPRLATVKNEPSMLEFFK
jgi:hypothetical protein